MKNSLPSHRSGGFTLVEVMAALAVLSILLVVMAGLMTNATKTMNTSTGRSDVEEQARIVFATMGNDFNHMVRQINTDSIFKSDQTSLQTGNDYMYFYSETPGYYAASITPSQRGNMSLVGYLIDSTGSTVSHVGSPASIYQYRLQRMAKGLCWDSSVLDANGKGLAPVFVTYPIPTAYGANAPVVSPISGTTLDSQWPAEVYSGAGGLDGTNYAVLGSDVFRMEYCFLYSNGTIGESAYYNGAGAAANAKTHIYGLQDVTGIIVSLAMIDERSRTLAGAASIQALAAQLPDFNQAAPTTQPTLPAAQWQTLVDTNALTGAPAAALSQVRIFQHVFYLNQL